MKKPTQKLTRKLVVARDTIRHLHHELALVIGGRNNLTITSCPSISDLCDSSYNVEC